MDAVRGTVGESGFGVVEMVGNVEVGPGVSSGPGRVVEAGVTAKVMVGGGEGIVMPSVPDSGAPGVSRPWKPGEGSPVGGSPVPTPVHAMAANAARNPNRTLLMDQL